LDTWTALIAGKIEQAVIAGHDAIALSNNAPNTSWLRLNLAHALLFSGQRDEARKIYMNGLSADVASKEMWKQSIVQDFATLRSRGFPVEAMDGIEKEMQD
jgi:predicted Zn-dependent protease